MTESRGEIKGIAEAGNGNILLLLFVEPVGDTLDALCQVYEWRIGERVRVIGNEPSK